MAPLERRRRPGSPWIVKDMIERQHISHHYRRVVEAKSSLTASASGASRRRCGAFTSACDLERRLDQLEKQLADHLNLTSKMASGSRPSPAKLEKTLLAGERASRCRVEVFDQSLDLMCSNAKYFTQPVESFTPRLVKRIPRPTSAMATARVLTRAPSDESAFGEAATARSSPPPPPLPPLPPQPTPPPPIAPATPRPKTARPGVPQLPSFDFGQWLRKQDEENRYLQLLCDITAELLRRPLCTNGGVKRIIDQHIGTAAASGQRFDSADVATLRRRLCADLLVPTDAASDRHFYGSGGGKERAQPPAFQCPVPPTPFKADPTPLRQPQVRPSPKKLSLDEEEEDEEEIKEEEDDCEEEEEYNEEIEDVGDKAEEDRTTHSTPANDDADVKSEGEEEEEVEEDVEEEIEEEFDFN